MRIWRRPNGSLADEIVSVLVQQIIIAVARLPGLSLQELHFEAMPMLASKYHLQELMSVLLAHEAVSFSPNARTNVSSPPPPQSNPQHSLRCGPPLLFKKRSSTNPVATGGGANTAPVGVAVASMESTHLARPATAHTKMASINKASDTLHQSNTCKPEDHSHQDFDLVWLLDNYKQWSCSCFYLGSKALLFCPDLPQFLHGDGNKMKPK